MRRVFVFIYIMLLPALAKAQTYTEDSLPGKYFRQSNGIDPFGQLNPARFLFKNKDTVIYFKATNRFSRPYFWSEYTNQYYDTLQYDIENDSVLILYSGIDRKLVSKKMVQIRESPRDYIFANWNYSPNNTAALNRKLKVNNDTVYLNCHYDRLLAQNLRMPMVSVYVNGVFKCKLPLKQKDTVLIIIGNFMTHTLDSAKIRIVLTGLLDSKSITREKTFVVKGYGEINLPVDFTYQYDFSVCPYKRMIMRGNRIYCLNSKEEANIFDYFFHDEQRNQGW